MKKLLTMAVAAALAAGVGTGAAAQERLVVAGYGGSFEEIMRKDVFPPFEKKHGAKIDYVAGNSTNTVARLQAQKANQEIDVAIVDDGPMYQAIALGFCAPIEKMPKDDIYATARYKDDKAVGLGIVATGLMYNKKVFQEKGWAPPKSWKDLADPKYKQLVVIPPLNNTYGLHAVVQFAKMNGGSEKNIDPGFKAFVSQINPNVLVYEPSPGKMTELFQSGQAVLAVWGSGRVKTFADTGFPVGFVYPEEGAYALLASVCPVAKPNAKPLAQEFVAYLLTPEIQSIMGTAYGYGPVNKKASAKDDPNVPLPIGDRAANLIVADWDTINANRDDWNKRWTREVER
ncbi:ABC transporter substrate-binding protein [Parapusillimonas granuli]|uniref:ABC transporter substrate-binding protein n=1 Tax=Parapusillimonas granuli TaxID=380911 RepID=A0A853FX22_9BURK|nr:ABC transporter substrate-binding protein [Parapusillimonas granuli]MBB5213852.1 putative spermidine/putrescine transport system substrate-binding protein [Parapusillimonas granuli]MEB2398931.1 ABC transporter substrate-binding protein [Alcaligenaceae bacterium]NYT48687.1 ABC transporter substrate-binding protein [Parapusillimonas granuli]